MPAVISDIFFFIFVPPLFCVLFFLCAVFKKPYALLFPYYIIKRNVFSMPNFITQKYMNAAAGFTRTAA